MMKRTQVQAIVLMAVGALVGYAAASDQLTSLCQAQAASEPRESPQQGSPDRLVAQRGQRRDYCWPRPAETRLVRTVLASLGMTAGSRTSS